MTDTDKSQQKQALSATVDLGQMVVDDCQSYAGLKNDEWIKKTQANLSVFFNALFDLKKQQRL